MKFKSTSKQRLVLLIALVPSLALAGALHWLLSSYSAMLAAVDGASYLPTRVLMDFGYWLPLLPLAVAALWRFWPQPDQRAAVAVIAGYFGSALIFLFGLLAVYWPIFQLGAVQ